MGRFWWSVCVVIMGLVVAAPTSAKRAGYKHDPRELARCTNYLQCATTDERKDMLYTVLEYDFSSVAQKVQSCPNPVPELEACDFGTCDVVRYQKLAIMANEIYKIACEHKADFERGSTCWAAPFQRKMQQCKTTHNYLLTDPRYALRVQCYGNVPRSLDACTTDDAEFVLDFSRKFVQSSKDIYT